MTTKLSMTQLHKAQISHKSQFCLSSNSGRLWTPLVAKRVLMKHKIY